MKKIAILLFLSCFSGACMSIDSLNPFKKEVVLMSPLKGDLVKNGVPLANVDIEVIVVMPGGEERVFKHKSNSSGQFDLPLVKDVMTIGPMTEFAVSQFVEVLVGGERHTVWSAGKRSPGLYEERYPPSETIGLVCDLDDERIKYQESAGYIRTSCKWDSLKEL